MSEREPRRPRLRPDGSVDVESYLTPTGRADIPLGTKINQDGVEVEDGVIPGYIEDDGVRYHPERKPKFLE